MTRAPEVNASIVVRARTLLENTKRLRFFRGQVYDGDADLYLEQLHGLLEDVIAALEPKP